MKRILISTSSFGRFDLTPVERLKEHFEVILNPTGRQLREDECKEFYKEIDGIIAGTEKISVNVLKNAKKLKVISRCGAGLDNVDLVAAKKLNIKVYNTPDAPTQPVAELTLGLILALLRNISENDRLVRNNSWKKAMGNLLEGKTLGVIGLGRIGKRLVELTRPFGLNYIAWDSKIDEVFAKVNSVRYVEDLHQLLEVADIISLHLPSSPQTKYLLNSEQFDLVKNSAVIINSARGDLIKETELCKALETGKIAGAALDVFEQEPYTGALLSFPNVILSPHVGSYARESRVNMEMQAVDNLLKGFGLCK